MLLRDRIAIQQQRRNTQIEVMRSQASARLAEQRAASQARIDITRALENERARLESERIEKRRIWTMQQAGDTALTLRQVMALQPCGRIHIVKGLLGEWSEGVTAQQALDAGCTMVDIRWVMIQLKRRLDNAE